MRMRAANRFRRTKLVRTLCAAAIAATALPVAVGDSAQKEMRIISTDGITTEILFALGAGSHVIARDSGSTYPEAAQELPDIGTGHQLNAEAILAMHPTLVIGRERPMSQPGFKLLEAAGAKVIRLDDTPGVEQGIANIQRVARIVGAEKKAEQLVASIEADLAKLDKKIEALDGQERLRVLVVYLRPNAAMLMGDDSNAVTMTQRVGAESAIPGLEGYKSLNAEAVVAARPDAILTYAQGLVSVGGIDGLLGQPGIALTPAGENRRIIALNDHYLGGFGPRMGEAALTLYEALFESEGTIIKE